MYTDSQKSRLWISIGPLAVMCCLGLVLFLISSVIVLSLIPIYLPVRNKPITLSSVSTPQSIILTLSSNDSVPIGSTLDVGTQNSIENQMQEALNDDSSLTTKVSTIHVLSATGTTSSQRKRRQSSSRTTEILVIYQLTFSLKCSTKACQKNALNLVHVKFLPVIINIDSTDSSSTSATTTTTTTTIDTSTTIPIATSTTTPIDTSTTTSMATSTTTPIATSTTTPIATSTTTPIATSTTISNDDQVIGDINQISEYWANIRPYMDSPSDYFGVNDTGLPDGCQVEQAYILHRHGARYPTNQLIDGLNIDRFALTIYQIRSTNNNKFTGPLSFLNTWVYTLSKEILVSNGAAGSYKSGVDFWNKYGRILYNANPGQTYYNESDQPKILLRTSSVLRMFESALHWANGYFGLNADNEYSLLSIPSSPGVNNTLAGNQICLSALLLPTGNVDLTEFFAYLAIFLSNATTRLSAYAPLNINFTVEDTVAMQMLCAYEYSALDSSDFCSLFTLNEWRGFEQLFNVFFYQAYSFGSYTGRAVGLGYLEELIARLNKQFINISYSSVNSTLDSSSETFPLNQTFYMDMTSDTAIVAFLTALSFDYFRENVSYVYPPQDNRHFRISHITPFSARLITEKIGCASSSPISTNSTRTQYSQTQYNYSPDKATHKFIRMRLNNAILPLDTIRGGFCSIGRTDGLCPMENFIASQQNASLLANFQFVCYGDIDPSNFTGDGTIFP